VQQNPVPKKKSTLKAKDTREGSNVGREMERSGLEREKERS